MHTKTWCKLHGRCTLHYHTADMAGDTQYKANFTIITLHMTHMADVYICVMRKVRIGTILGLPRAKFGYELCAGNPRIVRGLPHALPTLCTCAFNLLHVCVQSFARVRLLWMMFGNGALWRFEKSTKETFLSGKEVRSKVLMRSQGEQVKSFFLEPLQ